MTNASKIMVYREWWPASVLLPDGTQWHRVRVYATTEGLMIFRARKPEPDWSSPLDLEATTKPSSATVLNVGVDLHTQDGLVVLTPTGGGTCCGGKNSLKVWRPDWASSLVAWPS